MCSSTKFRLRPSLIRLNVGSIGQNFEGASLFPLNPLRICMCARALPTPPRICFSPTITINPYHQYFPFTLFAPLIFHSAWRLSWNLVNTGKLKTSSKGLSYLNVASFSRKKILRPSLYKFIDAPSSAFESRILYTSVNFCFFLFSSLPLSPHFSILRRNYVFSIAMTLFPTFTSFLILFYFRNKITGWKKLLQPVYWNEI